MRFVRQAVLAFVLAAAVPWAGPVAEAPPAPDGAVVWGANGHRIVGAVAERHLTDRARASVEALIGPESLAQVSTWADEIRSDPRWAHAAPWHYVTIEDDETYGSARKNPRGDIVEAMKRFERVLRDPAAPRPRKAEALKFLVHFIGDVHQPLHVGRGADLGGNRVDVHWFDEAVNLHAVWDEHLIAHRRLSFTEYAGFIDHAPPDSMAAWQRSTCLDWVRESKALRAGVYGLDDFSRHVDGEGRLNLGYAFIFETQPTIDRRLLQAGVRLAGLLNAVYDMPLQPTCDLDEIPTVEE